MAAAEPLLTVPERTEYRETSRASDVDRFYSRLGEESDLIHVESFGTSPEGRDMKLVVLSAHGAFTPKQARARKRPIVLILNNIHGGEVCGKEASQMLARRIVRERPALAEALTLLIVPIFNIDGNERISTENRKLNLEKRHGQIGPEGGAGTRHTAQKFDLNREYINQVAPEMRQLTQNVTQRWNPDLTIDCHTTNGSIHGYHLTYSFPENPAAHPAPVAFVRDRLLPEVTRRVERRTGFRTFFYGNYRTNDDPASGWATYACLPRFGSRYRGLTGRMSVLLEAYSYIPFKERVEVTLAFLTESLDFAIEQADTILKINKQAEEDTILQGHFPGPDNTVGLRWELQALEDEIELWTSEKERVRTRHFMKWVPTLSVRRPTAYLLAADVPNVKEKLRDHGVRMGRLTESTALEVERFAITKVGGLDRGGYLNPGGKTQTELTGETSRVTRTFDAGTLVVRTGQPLGNLIIYLLEPLSDDGLVTWHYLDDALREGKDYPIYRLTQNVGLKVDHD